MCLIHIFNFGHGSYLNKMWSHAGGHKQIYCLSGKCRVGVRGFRWHDRVCAALCNYRGSPVYRCIFWRSGYSQAERKSAGAAKRRTCQWQSQWFSPKSPGLVQSADGKGNLCNEADGISLQSGYRKTAPKSAGGAAFRSGHQAGKREKTWESHGYGVWVWVPGYKKANPWECWIFFKWCGRLDTEGAGG